MIDFIISYENEILQMKNCNRFDTMLELAVLENEYNDTYLESAKDMTMKVKSLINRFTKALSIYVDNSIKIFSLYKEKNDVERTITSIEKILKKNPDLAKQKIKYRLFSDAKDEIDLDTKICKNIAYRIENLDERWLTDLMDKYYENIDCTNAAIHDVTIEQALNNNKAVLENIEKNINNTFYSIRKIKDNLDKSENLTGKHAQIFRKFIKSIQLYIQRRFQLVTLNIEYFFQRIRLSVLSLIQDESEELVIKKNSRISTIIKHSTKVDTVDILGFKIELYETDRLIESEFTTINNEKYQVFFDKTFLDKPRAHQKAILYHEYGHIINGHLGGNRYRNERELSKIMKKRIRKYLRYIISDKNNLKDDDLLIYLLIELEADEFSSKYVGKKIMKRTLEDGYADLIKRSPKLTETEIKNTLAVAYTRTHMM